MRTLLRFAWLIFPFTALGLISVTGTFLYLNPRLPSVETLKDVRLQEPLRVYTADGKLMGEFGEMRRTPVNYADVPRQQLLAILAAEDDRFLQHHGIDFAGLTRAAWELVSTGSIQSGGSTITMQVAKNYFLSRERTFIRKFNEILLAIQIERELTKHEIMELYLNKIFLGHRAYGIAAAAQVYYGVGINELTLAQQAMIAGLPKAPSALNPLDNPTRAVQRRNWILGRMRQLGNIDDVQYQEAVAAQVTARYHGSRKEVEADYAAEMVRQEMLERFGRSAYSDGYVVYSTIDSRLQLTANDAIRTGLVMYDRRHGFRGAEQRLTPPPQDTPQAWADLLSGIYERGGMLPAVVRSVAEQSLSLVLSDATEVTLQWGDGLSSARRFITPDYRGPSPKSAADIAQPGDVLRLRRTVDGYELGQIPAAQGALVSMDARDGAIRAVNGGFDFRQSNFNRVTQAQRLPGSNIKPFIYACAMENGFSPASIINDAPIVFEDAGLENEWRPENDTGKFYGPTSLRTGLLKSRNLVSIRLLQQLGVDTAVDYLVKLGFPRDDLPPNLSLALGTLTTTPLRLVSKYALLANGGYQVNPYLVSKVVDAEQRVIFEAQPQTACADCITGANDDFEEASSLEELLASASPEQTENHAPQVMDPRAAYMIDSILKDAIRFGTGRRALTLKRKDIAGKTGTTNGPTDAWFSGYVGNVVTTAWVGFDQNQPLGKQEYGGSAALPIWIDYMRVATEGMPTQVRPRPNGLVSVRIDPKTGLLATTGQEDARFELFPVEHVPTITPNGEEPSDRYVPDEYNSHQIF